MFRLRPGSATADRSPTDFDQSRSVACDDQDKEADHERPKDDQVSGRRAGCSPRIDRRTADTGCGRQQCPRRRVLPNLRLSRPAGIFGSRRSDRLTVQTSKITLHGLSRFSRENATASRASVGLVWWPELDPLCRPGEGLVHVIEAEPETFWVPRDMKSSGFMSRLAAKLEHMPQPKLLHCVGAPFGGGAMQTASHREVLAGDIAALQPAWISDHLSFNQFVVSGANGADQVVSTGFFLPPAQCRRGVEIAAEQIRRRRVTTGVPVAFEVPVSYLPRRPGEMPDRAFAAEVAAAADCGILLDLRDLLCNERNGRQSVAEFCQFDTARAGFGDSPCWWRGGRRLLGRCPLRSGGTGLDGDLGRSRPATASAARDHIEIMQDYIASVGLASIGKMLGELDELWLTHASEGGQALARSDATKPAELADTITPGMWELALGAAVTEIAIPELPAELAEWVRLCRHSAWA